MKHEIHLPATLHPDTQKLVIDFAEALAKKLLVAQQKRGFTNHWKREGWRDECAECLIDHLQKGDPRDVAAYCAFMWHHGWSTSLNVQITA